MREWRSKKKARPSGSQKDIIEVHLKELDPENMPIAFVLINVEANSEDEVIQELKAIDNVKSVYFVYGVYDIVAKIEARTEQELKQTITWKVRRLERIRSTQTLMVSS